MFARQTQPDLRELLAPNVAAAKKILANLETTDPDDEIWRNKIFALFTPRMSQRIAREYEELFVFSGEQTANLYLLEHWERVRKEANIADSLGHVAAFLTITCPSRMHARLPALTIRRSVRFAE